MENRRSKFDYIVVFILITMLLLEPITTQPTTVDNSNPQYSRNWEVTYRLNELFNIMTKTGEKHSLISNKIDASTANMKQWQGEISDMIATALSNHSKELANQLDNIEQKYTKITNKMNDFTASINSIRDKLSQLESSTENHSDEFDSSKYRLFTVRKTWSYARRFCQSKGMDLTTVDSMEELSFLRGLIEHRSENCGHCFWTSGNNYGGEWRWGDSDRKVLYGWGPKEPSGDGNCAEINYNNAWNLDFDINDRSCSLTCCFVCKV